MTSPDSVNTIRVPTAVELPSNHFPLLRGRCRQCPALLRDGSTCPIYTAFVCFCPGELPRILPLAPLYHTGTMPATDRVMLAASFSLAFFGFLRCSELLSLTQDDILVSPDSSHLNVVIKRSKTDPFRQGCKILIGTATSQMSVVCPHPSYSPWQHHQPASPSSRARYSPTPVI